MTDLHLRILRLLAKQRQRELDHHDAAEHTGDARSAGRRRDLERAATRTGANVAAAEARRRFPRLAGER
jgi:hypothetical protein